MDDYAFTNAGRWCGRDAQLLLLVLLLGGAVLITAACRLFNMGSARSDVFVHRASAVAATAASIRLDRDD